MKKGRTKRGASCDLKFALQTLFESGHPVGDKGCFARRNDAVQDAGRKANPGLGATMIEALHGDGDSFADVYPVWKRSQEVNRHVSRHHLAHHCSHLSEYCGPLHNSVTTRMVEFEVLVTADSKKEFAPCLAKGELFHHQPGGFVSGRVWLGCYGSFCLGKAKEALLNLFHISLSGYDVEKLYLPTIRAKFCLSVKSERGFIVCSNPHHAFKFAGSNGVFCAIVLIRLL